MMEKLINSRFGDMRRVEKPRKFKIYSTLEGCKEIVHRVSFFYKWIHCNHLAYCMLLRKARKGLARFVCARSYALSMQIEISDFFTLLLQLVCFVTIWQRIVGKL